MKITKLKVRPKKDKVAAPCAAEFAAMLACWASSNDINSVGPCKDMAKGLQDCMASRAPRGNVHKSTINYHLGRLGKHM